MRRRAHPQPRRGLGLNDGIQDAHSLASKLALVHHGAVSEALLDSYHEERRPIAVATPRGTERVRGWTQARVVPERLLPLIPLVLASACFNAFGEEVGFRAGPLATLHRVVAGRQVGLLTLVVRACPLLGVPLRLSGAIASGLLGLAFGRAMVRTRGLGWPLIMHITSWSTRRSCSPSPPHDVRRSEPYRRPIARTITIGAARH